MKKLLSSISALLMLTVLTACVGKTDQSNHVLGTETVSRETIISEMTQDNDASGTENSTAPKSNRDEHMGAIPTQPEAEQAASEKEATEQMQIRIGDTVVTVEWENNASVEALKQLVKQETLVIQMSMYGGFEQVGPIGQSLPRNDVQITTVSGDIALYSGNQIAVFYGSNSWAYTRLGHITDKTPQEIGDLLGNGDVMITINMGG